MKNIPKKEIDVEAPGPPRGNSQRTLYKHAYANTYIVHFQCKLFLYMCMFTMCMLCACKAYMCMFAICMLCACYGETSRN